jgi:catechol 2,3-dioxygenase-like lactoylglutathione lyase family enzyme
MFLHDHVALTVKDLNVSRDFYQSLGGHVVSKPSSGFLEIVLGEVRLHLVPTSAAEDGRPSSRIDHLCMRVGTVEDLTALQDVLRSHPLLTGRAPCEVEDSPPLGDGGKIHVEEHPPRKTLYFEDPDGIRLEVRAYS